jgi:3',5'-cyclic AMP phosphodiesterase CpdA
LNLRLLHLSDIHFGGENVEALGAATAFAQANPFDLMVISGDVTQLGAPAEFAAAAAWLTRLPGPHLTLPGNHDTPWFGLVERVRDPFGHFERAIGPAAERAFQGPSLAVRAFNSARGWQIRLNWSKGAVSRRQAERAATALEAAPDGAVRIAACHHPLIEARGEPITARVRGGHAAARRLVAAATDIVLTGHLHTAFVEALPFGDGRTYAVGAGTLSLRLRGQPPGFNLLEVTGDTLAVTAMAWTGRDLIAQQTWEVGLRPREEAAAGDA